jgi:hypothetical protein
MKLFKDTDPKYDGPVFCYREHGDLGIVSGKYKDVIEWADLMHDVIKRHMLLNYPEVYRRQI